MRFIASGVRNAPAAEGSPMLGIPGMEGMPDIPPMPAAERAQTSRQKPVMGSTPGWGFELVGFSAMGGAREWGYWLGGARGEVGRLGACVCAQGSYQKRPQGPKPLGSSSLLGNQLLPQ